MKYKVDPRFFLFLALSIVLWQFTNLAKPISVNKAVKVRFEVPKNDYQLISDSILSIDTRVTATGLRLLFNSPYNKIYSLSTESMIESNNEFYLIPSDVESQLQKTFGEAIAIEKIFAAELKIPLARIASKKVPVSPNISLSFKQNYILKGDLILKPDSVKISAPEAILKDISSINTVALKLDNLTESVNQPLAIDFSQLGLSSIEQEKVVVNAEVVRFSEMVYEVPILLPEFENGMRLAVFPSNAQVVCKAPADVLKALDSGAFGVTVDFDFSQSLDSLPSRLPLKFSYSPSNVLEVFFSNDRVNYILEKQ
ncbi:MAG: CdaR family protein [Flavobacteriaceae bacterium]